MAHGFPSGLVRLYDEEGNPVEVVLQQNGNRALATSDERLYRTLEEIRKALENPEETNPWALNASPWKGLS